MNTQEDVKHTSHLWSLRIHEAGKLSAKYQERFLHCTGLEVMQASSDGSSGTYLLLLRTKHSGEKVFRLLSEMNLVIYWEKCRTSLGRRRISRPDQQKKTLQRLEETYYLRFHIQGKQLPPMLLNFKHSEVLKLLSFSQAAHSLLSPCDSRKSCFIARFALSSCCHLFGFPPPIFSVERNTELCKHLQLPMSLCLILPPTTAGPQPPPQHTLMLWQVLGITPLPVARSVVHCISWNHSCTKKAQGQCLPAPKPQAPQLRGSNQQREQGQAAFSTKTVGGKQQRFLGLQSCAEVQSGGNHMPQSNNSEWPTCCFCDWKYKARENKRRGGMGKARVEVTNSYHTP